MKNPKKSPKPETLMILWDDNDALTIPMVWDKDCEGAICAGVGVEDRIALFDNFTAARKAITISAKWNALLKSQGKTHNSDFEKQWRKYIRVVRCQKSPSS